MRKFIIAILLLCFAWLAIKKYIKDSSDRKFEGSFYYVLSPSEKHELQTGDIILRRGYGFVSSMILKMMKERLPVTHIGIILNEQDGLKVAHTLSSSVSDEDGLRIQPIDAFTHNSHDSTLLVVRLKEFDQNSKKDIQDQVQYYLKRNPPFDKTFDYKDTTAYYCSELIWRIYEHNLKILKIHDSISADEKYQTLKMFYDTNYVEYIINHHQ